jgi:hypothetical protein
MSLVAVLFGWLLLLAGPLLFLSRALGLTRTSTFRASLLTATGWVVLAYARALPNRLAYGAFIVLVAIASAVIRLRTAARSRRDPPSAGPV